MSAEFVTHADYVESIANSAAEFGVAKAAALTLLLKELRTAVEAQARPAAHSYEAMIATRVAEMDELHGYIDYVAAVAQCTPALDATKTACTVLLLNDLGVAFKAIVQSDVAKWRAQARVSAHRRGARIQPRPVESHMLEL